MSHGMRLRMRLIVLGLALSAGWAAARDESVKGLKYRFKAGETYVYTVTIVGEIGSTKETTKGKIQLTAKSVKGDQLQLTPNVVLSTDVQPPQRSGLHPARPNIAGMLARMRPGYRPPARELTIDRYGKLLALSGETGLPLLLGTAEQLVVEPLSRSAKTWKQERNIVIVESKESKTPAKEVVTYEVTSTAGSLIKIKKNYDLKTVVKGQEEPRIQLKGTSELIFDADAGVIKSGEFKGAIILNEKTVTLRIPLTASHRLMTAAELETERKEAEAARLKREAEAKEAAKPKPISDATLTRALAAIKAGKFKASSAAERLAKSIPIDARRKEVVEALKAVLKLPDDMPRANAAHALKVWSEPSEAATFIELLNDKNVRVRSAAYGALAKFKDPKGAEAVAQRLRNPRSRRASAATLKAMGKVAEKAVLPLVKDSDAAVRMEACKLLGEIGTKESLSALKGAQADSNRLVASEARKAVKAVEGR